MQPPPKRKNYKLGDLEPGAFVLIEGKTASNIAGSIGYVRLRHPEREYRAETIKEGVRVWRIT